MFSKLFPRAIFGLTLMLMLAGFPASAQAPSAEPQRSTPEDLYLLLDKKVGDEYVQMRNKLLAEQTLAFDVVAASEKSGRAGLAAFVLDQRRAAPDQFREWDAQSQLPPPSNRRGVVYFRNERPGVAGEAFLLEQMWRPARSGADAAAFVEMGALSSRGWVPQSPSALWRSLWTDSPNDYLAQAALIGIGADRSDAGRALASAILADEQNVPLSWRELMLESMRRGKSPFGVEVVSPLLQQFEPHATLFAEGCRVLAASPQAAAREQLHQAATDDARTPERRMVAWEACTTAPQAGDAEVLTTLLKNKAISDDQKEHAVSLLDRYPYEQAAPALRQILNESTSQSQVYYAAHTLARLHAGAGVPAAARAGDIEMLQGVSQRGDLAESVRKSVAEAAQSLRAKQPARE